MKQYRFKSVYDSWYPAPVLNELEAKYIVLIQNTFKVQYPNGEWKHIKLTNHQAEFHKYDIAIQQVNAPNRIVVKSRNTSFTTSAIISMLSACYFYRDQIIPLTRINDDKVKELIKEFEKVIKHITPVKLDNNDLFPFNPETVEFTAHEIYIPDRGVTIKSYPASASASENIRGIRTNLGLNDETNFESEFQNIHTALTQAKKGADLGTGLREFQYTYGTTRKGKFTNWNLWFERIEKLVAQGQLKNIKIFRWPVFDPQKFDVNKPISEQKDLVPIVPWHTLNDLEEDRINDERVFLEEYMAELTDDDETFYPINKVQACVDSSLNNIEKRTEFGQYYMAIDPAAEHDFFAITMFDLVDDEYIQKYMFYDTKIDLQDMEYKCKELIRHYLDWGLKRVIIDGNGIGFQLSESLKKEFGTELIKIIRGNQGVKIDNKLKVSLNEFMHNNMKKLIIKGKIKLIEDEMQMIHYSGWDYNYKCKSTKEYGHGDIVSANVMAVLPDNYKVVTNNKTLIGNLEIEKKTYEQYRNMSREEQMLERMRNIYKIKI